MFWFLTGILLVLLARNHFDLQGVEKDLKKIARELRRIGRDLAAALRNRAKDVKKETRETGPEQAVPAAGTQAEPTAQAAPQQACGLPEDPEPEKAVRTAAMLANVPTLAFPEDDPKYDSSRKYRYA